MSFTLRRTLAVVVVVMIVAAALSIPVIAQTSGKSTTSKPQTITGTVTKVDTTNNMIWVQTKTGVVTVQLTCSTPIMIHGTRSFLSQLKTGSPVEVHGTKTGTNQYTAKSVVVRSSASAKPGTAGGAGTTAGTQTISGKVTKVDTAKNMIWVQTKTGTVKVKVTSSTSITSKGTRMNLSQVPVGQMVSVRGTKTGKNQYTATSIIEQPAATSKCPAPAGPATTGGAGTAAKPAAKTTSISGTVTKVDPSKNMMVVRMSNGKTMNVMWSSSTTMMSQGKKMPMSQMKTGMMVTVHGQMTGSNTMKATSITATPKSTKPAPKSGY